MTQQLLPAVHVEAHGEEAQRLIAAATECDGMLIDGLESGCLRELVKGLVAFYEKGESIECEREIWLLERLGFLGGAAAQCCARAGRKP